MTPMTRDELLAELIRERFGAPPQPPAEPARGRNDPNASTDTTPKRPYP